jgi:hypothetical protein
MTPEDTSIDRWIADLERRHLQTSSSARCRALRALSSTYVERRHGIQAGAALSERGSARPCALYGPLHFSSSVTSLASSRRV